MTDFINDADRMLQDAETRYAPVYDRALVLTCSSLAGFKVSAAGLPTPAEIVFTPRLINLVGSVSYTVTGGLQLAYNGNEATLAFANMSAESGAVTVNMTFEGQSYSDSITIWKVRDGAKGDPGVTGDSIGHSQLFMWSTAAPAAPIGTATFTWPAASNTGYNGADGWSIIVPPNPGTPLAKLWVADKPVTAPAGTVTTAVTYGSGATIVAYSQNGANGAPGIKSAQVRAYRWGNGPAPTIAGTSTYDWPSGTFNNIPVNWSASKQASPGPGYTLYEGTVNLVETAGAATSAIDWTTAAIVGISYTGLNGTGSSGDSAMIAYTLVDGSSLNVTPSTITKPARGLPVSGDWGSTRGWTSQPAQPSVGQSVLQSNGIYNGTTDQTTWSVPYLSNWRVGSLAAISANLGAITAGSINIGNGNAVIDINGFATFRKLTVIDDQGRTILGTGIPLHPDYAPSTMLNKSGDVLGGIISINAVTAPAGFRAGSLTWDINGNRTGGYGVAMTPKGIVAYNAAGTATFALDASTGAATLSGPLSAMSATIGTFRTAASGARVEISDNLLEGFASNNVRRWRMAGS